MSGNLRKNKALAKPNSKNHQNAELPALTVIGAGNCQDIDLASLATQFREIRFVDIDPDAVHLAISKFAQVVTARIRVFAPRDIAAPLMALETFEGLAASQQAALLITDLVSSDTVPELRETSPVELPKLMFQCLQTGNFFSGLNPAVVVHDLQHLPEFVELCASCRILPPWHWHLGSRCFTVYAAELVRSDFAQ